MGYSHMFYALDVDALQKIYGSNDQELLAELLQSQADDIHGNDGFFEDEIEDGDLPNTETAIRQIFEGNPQMDAEGAMYGYALKIICEHLGEMIWGGEYGVADVSDHPYDSMLVKSGMPFELPEPSDFPMIGYLPLEQIEAEIEMAEADHATVASEAALQKSTIRSLANAVGLGLRSGSIESEEIKEDIDAYVETLKKAREMGKGVVSFRH